MSHHSALTIAGFDPSGGAGLIADLRTFFALGLAGRGIVTAVTAQTRDRVSHVVDMPPESIRAQLNAVIEEGMPSCLKTGMLASADTVDILADILPGTGCGVIVIDPVLVSTSGYPLLKEPGLRVLKARLLPAATAVTPNIEEAEKLSGMTIGSAGAVREAAARIFDTGVGGVVITGGHRHAGPDEPVVDLVFDGRDYVEVSSERVRAVNLHGTGCVYSAALTGQLNAGDSLCRAAEKAQRFLVDHLARRRRIDLDHPLC
jgi:hydroxymethylpyrimidine/phosphomethylpyrimidine kinase